jgi:hypothetical protein
LRDEEFNFDYNAPVLEIFLTLGIPAVFIVVVTLLRAAVTGKQCSFETSQEIAIDMTFLGFGAVGSVFNSVQIHSMLKDNFGGALAGMLLGDFIIVAVLFYCRKFYPVATMGKAFWYVAGGSLPLMSVAALTYLGEIYK